MCIICILLYVYHSELETGYQAGHRIPPLDSLQAPSDTGKFRQLGHKVHGQVRSSRPAIYLRKLSAGFISRKTSARLVQMSRADAFSKKPRRRFFLTFRRPS